MTVVNELEIEIKAACPDPAPVLERLRGLGAVFVHTIPQEDRYYNHPGRDFRETDEALRLRLSGDDTVITYKGPKLSPVAKTRREIETPVGDLAAMGRILVILGFRETGVVRKTRDVWGLGDIEICVDRVDGLGTFIELEKMAADRESVERELFDLASRLGLDAFERRSYLEMVLGKGR